MHIYTTLQIGEYHVNFCEDYLLTAWIGAGKMLCAVMDGCTMGTDSHFVATLTGKILRKTAKELYFKEFAEKSPAQPDQLLKTVMKKLFEDLKYTGNHLQLERSEMLSTLLLGVVDGDSRSAEFICIGDGLLCVDGVFYEFEQDNRPDYLGYHLNEDFETWFDAQRQKMSFQGVCDFSLVTDGIFTFNKFNQAAYPETGTVADYLLINRDNGHNPGMLDNKMKEIKNSWGLVPTDDLAIVRIILTI